MMKTTISIISLALVLWLLNGCGQQICVAGIGDCSRPFGTSPSTTSTQSGGPLNITWRNQRTVPYGERLELVISGGNAPYTFSILDVTGQVILDNSRGIINLVGMIATYTAPASNNNPPEGFRLTVRVRDNMGRVNQVEIKVNQQ